MHKTGAPARAGRRCPHDDPDACDARALGSTRSCRALEPPARDGRAEIRRAAVDRRSSTTVRAARRRRAARATPRASTAVASSAAAGLAIAAGRVRGGRARGRRPTVRAALALRRRAHRALPRRRAAALVADDRRARLAARPGSAAARPGRRLRARRPRRLSVHRADDGGAGAAWPACGRSCSSRRPAADGSLPAAVLAAARIAGVTEAYRIGGAQAVAALAYGTRDHPARRQDRGPRQHLRRARQGHGLRRRRASTWSPGRARSSSSPIAGRGRRRGSPRTCSPRPSTIRWRAPLLITDTRELLPRVRGGARARSSPTLPRRGDRRGVARAPTAPLILTANLEDGGGRGQPARARAPRARWWRCPPRCCRAVRNAGAVFLGAHTPEVVGDYVAGPNHVLPTGGHRALRVAAGHGGFREALERDRVLARRGCAAALPYLSDPGARRGPGRRTATRRPCGRDSGRREERHERPSRDAAAGTRRAQDEGDARSPLQLEHRRHRRLQGPDADPVLQPHAGGVVQARADGSRRRGAGRRRGRHPPHGGGRRHRASARRSEQALGDKRGIVRYGNVLHADGRGAGAGRPSISPGRPFLVFSVPVARTRVSNFDLDMLQEFFRAFAFNAEITLHVTMHYGHNLHHIAEAVFKSVGRGAGRGDAAEPSHRRRSCRRRRICCDRRLTSRSRRRGEAMIAALRAAAEGEARL